MKRLNIHKLSLRSALCSLVLFTLPAQAQLQEELAENWYRTEVLIFVRETAESRQAEQWEPLPTLEYPQENRYLLDPAVADRRLEESQSYASTIDSRGVQTLIVPAPIEDVLDHSRPDAMTTAVVELDLLLPGDGDIDPEAATDAAARTQTAPSGAAGTLLELSDDPNNPALDANNPEVDLQSPIIALPYELLDDDALEFRTQARSLRRQGHRIVFHGSWWAMLDEADQTPALIVDRSGDMDSLDWPALQGSMQIYRSRYLHIALDLWLNTQGEYLPEGWQIEAPPLPTPSVMANTLGGLKINPWSPPEFIDNALSEPALLEERDSPLDPHMLDRAIEAPSEQTASAPDYPWRHAITHRQSRRMRSGEIHYLDHPVIGVIVKVTPMSDEDQPLLPPQEREFRERHTLPIVLLPMNPESPTETP